jgi:hypothetical protein
VTGVTNHRNHAEERRAEEKTTTEGILGYNQRPRTAGAGALATLTLARARSYLDGHGAQRRRSAAYAACDDVSQGFVGS